MGLILKKTTVALAIFLAFPLVAIMTNWHWQPESLPTISHYLLRITESAGSPWALVISALLFVLFCLLLPAKRVGKIILVWLILFVAILSGQIVKSAIKSYAKEPRPYVLWMEKTAQVDHNYFYSLPKDRKSVV